ncbi:MAG: HisA/HisF-related TIM barrel protein, partial [Pauljensenia sp.]|nr:HisA/HisF-related TIM barrel protein [Pauljensenia sp.]
MTVLELLPAIDVTDGQAVRLSSGSVDAGSWGSPLEVAHSFAEAGARWVHLVDLDLAFGRGENSALVA